MATVTTLQAREVFNYSVEEIWGLEEKPLQLVFEDGTLGTTFEDDDRRIKEFVRMTRFSYYCAVFIRRYPQTPCLKHHHMDGMRFTKKVSLTLFNRGFFDAYDALAGQVDIEEMMQIVSEANNQIYNDWTVGIMKQYVTSMSIRDFIEVYKHPQIVKANQEVVATSRSIQTTYDQIDEALDSPELQHNPLVRVIHSNPKTRGQVHQILGPRGQLTEINGEIFPNAIMSGFLRGLKYLHDSMIESRSAAKALAFSDSIIRKSEYFNRNLQIYMAHITRIHQQFNKGYTTISGHDCGTQETIPFKVTSENLKQIAGKYRKTQEGQLLRIKEGDQHLVGHLISLRSVLKCEHPDPQGFCATCFGELALSIPYKTNLGHACATVFCEIMSQAILSAKHLDRSAMASAIQINQYSKRYIRPGFEENALNLTQEVAGLPLHLVIDSSEAKALSQLDQVKDVDELNLRQITELQEVRFIENMDQPGESWLVVPVYRGNIKASLSQEALRYVKAKGITIQDGSNYCIDLSDWDATQPLFVLPMKDTSMGDFMSDVETYFKSKATHRGVRKRKPKEPKCLRDHPTAVSALNALFEMIRTKVDINIAHLEVMVAATMVTDDLKGDYRTPIPADSGDIGSFSSTMKGRSLSAVMAWESQKDVLKSVRSFKGEGRPDHPMDGILVPKPTLPTH